MNVLLFDLLGGSHILLAVLRSLRHDPDTVVHLLAEHRLQPARFSRHAASYTATVPPNVLEQLSSLIRRRRIDAVIPSGIAAARFLSTNRRAIEAMCAVHPVPELEPLELARDKARLASHLERHGIPAPRTIVVAEPGGALGFFDSLDGPALAKPLLGAGGRGIVRIGSRSDLERWLKSGSAMGYLLQELIPGYDIDCSFLSVEGTVLAHTVQRGILPGISRYAAPGGAEFLDHPGAFRSASALASSLRWSGVAHIDMRYDERDGQVKILELNPRYWRSLLGSVAAGVNFPVLAVRYALGERFSAPQATPGRYVHETRIAVRQVAGRRGYRLGQTVLAESARDPLPEIALVFLHHRLPETADG